MSALGLLATLLFSQADAVPRPLSITVSGGVSLGTYEAGFLYLLNEDLKKTNAFETKMVTGASAGSANALVSALSSCLESNPYPSKDPGWLVWGDVGFKDLFDKQRVTGDALFTRDALEQSFAKVREVWRRGLPASCDVVLGVVVTRVTPRQVELQHGLSVPRIEEKFVVRIRGRGPGKAPRLSNYPPPSLHLAQPLLPLVPDEDDPVAADRNFSQLRSLIFASAAFPVAFAPQPIEYCLSKPVGPGEAPSEKTIECLVPEYLDLFMDGGVLDNNPLRLAWQVTDSQLVARADGRGRWAEPLTRPEETHHGTFHLYLDPDTTAYPPEEEERDDPRDQGIIRQFFRLGGGFVESARAKELYALAREQPDLSERMRLTVSQYPKASEHLRAFVGFFEKDFRVFDFTLGMYDAWRELKSNDPTRAQVVFDAARFAADAEYKREWRRFACMLSVYEPGNEELASACDDVELETFRILLQTSLDRLYAACQPTPQRLTYALGRFHHHCSRARQAYGAPQVRGVPVLGVRENERREGESPFDYFFRLLGAYGFQFHDLGLAQHNAELGRLALRRELDDVMESWAANQGTFADRVLARTAGRIALNNIQFSPPKASGYVVIGTVAEGGASIVPFGWRSHWFQAAAAFTVLNLTSLLTPGEQRIAFGVTGGPEVHLSFLSNAIVQPRLGVRAGVQLGTRDVFGSRVCSEVAPDPRWCTTWLLEGVVAVSLLERVRAQIVWQTYPGIWPRDSRWYNLHFGLGVQF